MNKRESNEKNTIDPWKNLPETQPLSLIKNGDTDYLLLSCSLSLISTGGLGVSVSVAGLP